MRLTVQKVRGMAASYELSPRDWKSPSIPEGGRAKKSKNGTEAAPKNWTVPREKFPSVAPIDSPLA